MDPGGVDLFNATTVIADVQLQRLQHFQDYDCDIGDNRCGDTTYEHNTRHSISNITEMFCGIDFLAMKCVGLSHNIVLIQLGLICFIILTFVIAMTSLPPKWLAWSTVIAGVGVIGTNILLCIYLQGCT